MEIKLGTPGSEKIFYFANVTTRRIKTYSEHIMLDGSKQIQQAPITKKRFDITFVKIFDETHENITNLNTEYEKGTVLNLIYNENTYSVVFLGELTSATSVYGTAIILQEV
ncbi:hypothetical protein ES705_11393 [subsurface metagenome]